MINALLPLTFFGTFAYAAIGPVADLPIVNGQVSPDGFTRTAILPGGTHPGPLIVGNKGDTFRINVKDQLTDTTMLRSTSIHWHGFNQHGTNWADGAAMVNQCPITPSKDFEYRFTATDQAGTYWYHSHFSTQYCDGLRGPMVVYDPNDPHKSLYDVDDESTVITLSDWYHLPAPQYGGVALPDATLINGKGRYPGGPAAPFAVITVESGKRYRFRLVSLSCDPNYIFSIDGHDMTVIEADGHNTKPVTVNSLQIHAGQRYSFVLNANRNTPASQGNFWIRALPHFSSSTNFNGGTNLAVLRYAGSPDIDPTTTAPTTDIRLQETDLHPLEDPSAPGNPTVNGADVDLNLVVTFSGGRFRLNGATYDPPTVPVLLQILSGAVSPGSLTPAASIYSLPPGKTVQLSFPLGTGGGAGGPHPIHLHGHPFSVVRSAGSSTYNFVDPVRRDVVSAGAAGDNMTIRFFTGTGNRGGGSSAGPWFLHCHIDRHMEGGLAVVFAEDSPNAAATNPVPTAWSDLCPEYRAEFGDSGEVVN